MKLILPHWLIDLRVLYNSTKPFLQRTCPICGFEGFFKFAGIPVRRDAKCPKCGMLERDRFLWLSIQNNLHLLKSPLLHFAPEPYLENYFRKSKLDYKTADLHIPCDLVLDIENLDLRSESISSIICNHVLEHVDDRNALPELFRILQPSGILICSVPIIDSWKQTFENSSYISEQDREIHFGQFDHVRFYGNDFATRIESYGFKLKLEILASNDEIQKYGLLRGERIFIFEK